MTLTLSQANWDDLRQQASKPNYPNLALDAFEELFGVPSWLGHGYCRSMQICPGVWLDLYDREFHHDWIVEIPAHDHPVQCLLLLSGSIYHSEMYPTLGGERSYLSGSGISPLCMSRYRRSQRLIGVNIEFLPEVLEQFLSGMADADTPLLKLLLKQNDWKVSFFPTVTAAMRRVAEQMLTTPLCGTARQLYLQAKVFELLTLQLQPILSDRHLLQPPPGRKADTIARTYHAREILNSCLENPPALPDLAQQVGLSDRTLRRGFQDLFGTTVVGYLTQQRMKEAEQRLREGNCTVAEVATQVGYVHLGHFAAGFKRQFGITPSQCLAGKRSS